MFPFTQKDSGTFIFLYNSAFLPLPAPQGTLVISGDIFGCHNLGHYWNVVGGGQGCCSAPFSALASPPQPRIPWPQMSVVPSLRIPALRFEKSEDNYTKTKTILVVAACFSQFLKHR